MSHPIGTGHATPEVAELVLSLFEQKSAASAAGFMSHFARDRLTYTDARRTAAGDGRSGRSPLRG
ncbi:hypothetical protein ACWEPC_11430 [Nonomuraea sp. NPDC004297]